jgi:hypothetical protein
VRIHRADIPPEISAKATARINEGMDKFQIEKVHSSSSLLLLIFLGYGNLCEKENG